jgi:hypothetical protein
MVIILQGISSPNSVDTVKLRKILWAGNYTNVAAYDSWCGNHANIPH